MFLYDIEKKDSFNLFLNTELETDLVMHQLT